MFRLYIHICTTISIIRNIVSTTIYQFLLLCPLLLILYKDTLIPYPQQVHWALISSCRSDALSAKKRRTEDEPVVENKSCRKSRLLSKQLSTSWSMQLTVQKGPCKNTRSFQARNSLDGGVVPSQRERDVLRAQSPVKTLANSNPTEREPEPSCTNMIWHAHLSGMWAFGWPNGRHTYMTWIPAY